MHNKKQVRGEGGSFGWWLVVCNNTAHHGGESTGVEQKADGHIVSTIKKQKATNASAELAFSFFLSV